MNSTFSVKMTNIYFTKLETQGNYKEWKTVGYNYLFGVAYRFVFSQKLYLRDLTITFYFLFNKRNKCTEI